MQLVVVLAILAIKPCSVNLLSNDRETVDDGQFVAAKWREEGIMLLGLSTKTKRKFNRKTKDKMTPELNVWVALHGQDKKEVTGVQFVEDQLNEKDVVSRAVRRSTATKNQSGSKRKQQLSTCIAQMMFCAPLLPLHLCIQQSRMWDMT